MASSSPMGRVTLITGASGFVGRALVPKLADLPDHQFRLLLRNPDALGLALPENCTILSGDLSDTAVRAEAVSGVDSVLHLAALTGKAAASTHRAVNEENTVALAEAAKIAGVDHFTFVSTIAAGYRDQSFYPYAQSKAAAEAALARVGLNYSILRPTLVMGGGSPVAESLAKIAGAQIVPLFRKNGPVSVQPIHVDDVVRALLVILEKHGETGEILELGGPERLSMQEFLGRLGLEINGKYPRFLPVPLLPIQLLLACMEPVLLSKLPATAGQFAVFANSSEAKENWLMSEIAEGMIGLDQILRETAPAPDPQLVSADRQSQAIELTEDQRLACAEECRAFAQYIAGRAPSEAACSAYVRGIEQFGLMAVNGSFDQRVLGLARKGRMALLGLDAFSALFARSGTLRRRLILLVAILEKTPPTAQVFHGTAAPGRVGSLMQMGGAALSSAAALVVGFVLALVAAGTSRRGRRS